MKIIDIGMYDGSDTRYYLEGGHRVVGVEANPALCDLAKRTFAAYVASGQLDVVNAAISNAPGELDLQISGRALSSSSLDHDRVSDLIPIGTCRVRALSFEKLLHAHPRADFIKIDIEGGEGECVRALGRETAPVYLSFEATEEIHDLVAHLSAIGYGHFKIIQQTTFRSLRRQNRIADRLARKAIRFLGYDGAAYVKRNGRLFWLEHSAGPAPWESDGAWESASAVCECWAAARERGELSGWYDVHAMRA